MKRLLFVLALTIFSLTSFAQSGTNVTQVTADDQSQSVEIFVNKKGKIQLNGKKISLNKLEKQLLELKKGKGSVKFAAESTSNKSARDKAVGELSKLFKKYGLEVKVFTDKSFKKPLLF